jgi:uncharacterized protein (TIGR03066 family)
LNRGGGGAGGGGIGGGGGRGGEGIGGGGKGQSGIANQSGSGARNSGGIANKSNNNANSNNTRGGNTNNGTINAGNKANINNSGNTYNHYGNNYAHQGYNNGWHNGYWPGYHPYGYGWGGVATAGLVGWGLGSMANSSGYGGGYSNPYYVSTPQSSGTYADYSAPIQAAPQSQTQVAAADQNAETPPSPAQAEGLKSFDAAREAFRAGNFDLALTKVEEALKQLPNDAAFHEFRGLVLFAQAKYQDAASAIYAVLSVGPGWNWTTLSGMYASIDDYTKQLRALEAYGKQHPDSPDAAFLLGYHYLTCGYNEQAAKQLQIVIELLPEDRLAPQLLQMVSGNTSGAASQPPAVADATTPADNPAANDGPPVDKGKLVGTWKASPAKGVAIELTLKNDSNFVWKVTQAGKPNALEGQYSVEGNQLSLQQKSNGETMAGRVMLADNGGFNFKLTETGPGDPGLNFSK